MLLFLHGDSFVIHSSNDDIIRAGLHVNSFKAALVNASLSLSRSLQTAHILHPISFNMKNPRPLQPCPFQTQTLENLLT